MRDKNDIDEGYLDPAATVISRFGGTAAVADLLELDKSTVCQWRNPKPRGTGGLIPSRHHADLLAWARKLKIRVTATTLVQRPSRGRFQGQVTAGAR